MSVVVVKPGSLTTIQSGPRFGSRQLGVPSSGAADPLSLALANKLAGNDWDAPALETTLLGPVLRFEQDCSVAVTGAQTALSLNGQAVDLHHLLDIQRGDELVVAAANTGARNYIAFTGGLDADVLLGSASTYLVAGFGGYRGRALEKGDELAVRESGPVAAPVATLPEYQPPMAKSWAVRACASPETEQLADGGERLFGTNWTIGQRADRMGMQLQGPKLDITSDGRMPSAAVFPGTVQCPENGAPFVLSVDCGTVGGYPRVAQVARVDRHLLGQLRPGDHIRLSLHDPDEVIEEFRAKLDYWRPWLPEIESILF